MSRKVCDALERYQPSGKVSPRFYLLAVPGLALAALLGLGYQRLIEASPYVVLHVFLPPLLGLLLGSVAMLGIWLGAVRRAIVLDAFAGLLALAALIAAWFVRRENPDIVASYRALQPFAWAYEAISLTLMAFLIPRAWWRRAVYCEEAQRFVPREFLGRSWGVELLTLRRAAGEDGLSAILAQPFSAQPANSIEGEYRFWLRRSSEGLWLTLWWHGKLENPRGNRVRRDVLVLRRIRVTEDFLAQLEGKLQSS